MSPAKASAIATTPMSYPDRVACAIPWIIPGRPGGSGDRSMTKTRAARYTYSCVNMLINQFTIGYINMYEDHVHLLIMMFQLSI